MKTKMVKKILTWTDRLSLNAKGGAWLGLFSIIIALGCIDVLFLHRGSDIPEGVRWTYATVLLTFGGTKVANNFLSARNGKEPQE